MLKKLSSSIIIQLIGTLSSFLTVMLITNKFGLSKQGIYAMLKSWIDLAVVIVSIGLPQSVIYAINKLNISIVNFRYSINKYILVSIPFSILMTYIWFFYFQDERSIHEYDFFIIGFSVSFLLGHSLYRSIILTKDDGFYFSVITITPAVSLFVFILICYLIGYDSLNFSMAYLFSSLTSILLSILICYILFKREDKYEKYFAEEVPWLKIIKNGFGVFLQSIFVLLMPLVSFWLMRVNGLSDSEVGSFSISVYIYMMLVLPFNLVSPIFYNKWSKSKNENSVVSDVSLIFRFGALVLLMVLLLEVLIPFFVPLFFGDQVKENSLNIQIMVIGTIPFFFNSILACLILANGKFYSISIGYFIKTIFCISLIIIFFYIFIPSIYYVTFSWVISEFALLIYLYSITVKNINSKFRVISLLRR
ncbi:oligosaccharide flippase family protein [Pasteurellaceae bacterium TAE3-ERU1]|nr:oligosaccharide flippase family protein [Pasteurellaceae bacterium TAE3-ERU1]